MITKKIIIISLSIVFSLPIFADIICKGRIADANDLTPLIGATIMVENTTIGTASDFNGNFTIKVPDGSTLSVSYIGYCTAKLKAKANMGTITLQTNEEMLRKGDPEPDPTPEEIEGWIDEGLKLYDQKKYKEAFEKFHDAAIEDNARGEYLAAICYRDGIGTSKDVRMYVGNMFSSAEKGYAPAQYLLGLMYRDGDGVPKSLKAAEEFLKKAAAQGYDKAKIALYDLTSTK